jgi:hypothetical protein
MQIADGESASALCGAGCNRMFRAYFLQAVQKGRSARPQQCEEARPYGSYPPTRACRDKLFSRVRYVEPRSDARTKLAGFFNGLLGGTAKFPLNRIQHDRPVFHTLLRRLPSRGGGALLFCNIRPAEGFLRMAQFELCKLETPAYAG